MTWKQLLKQNFRDWHKLADFLELTDDQRKIILQQPRFPLNLPLRLANKITKGTLQDPILSQFLPIIDENKSQPGFVKDPTAEETFRSAPKLLHKYEGRALLVCSSVCVMNCRFCFRQNFPYEVNEKSFAKEIELISQDSSIHEVILSGGDPLSLSDPFLKRILQDIETIPHINRIRFHTRFPIGIPERIDSSFISLLAEVTKQIWFVIHVNHPRELDSDILSKMRELRKLGIIILNQNVLLRGVNDDVQTLKTLFEQLVDNGIVPYYLHQLDRVQGIGHFEVEESKGKELIQAVAALLPGYAIPKYVREIPGEPSKTFLT